MLSSSKKKVGSRWKHGPKCRRFTKVNSTNVKRLTQNNLKLNQERLSSCRFRMVNTIDS